MKLINTNLVMLITLLHSALASKNWKTPPSSKMNRPAIYKASLYVHSMPRDTMLHFKVSDVGRFVLRVIA